jgi:hypothetical protein
MADFFHRLSDDMSGGLGFQVVEDGLLILTALWCDDLRAQTADVLGRPVERVAEAVQYAQKLRQDRAEHPAGQAAVGEA